MENNAHGQIVIDAHKSLPFEHREVEAYPLSTSNRAVSSIWERTLRGKFAAFQDVNWVKPRVKDNPIIAVICFIGCAIGVGAMAMAAFLTHSPFVFPSLGILAKPWQLEVIIGAVVLLTLFAVLFNRLAGIPHPLWKTVSQEVPKKIIHETPKSIILEGSLQVCIIGTDSKEASQRDPEGSDRGEGCDDTNLRLPERLPCSSGQFTKREGLSRIKRTRVRLVPLNADKH